MERTIFIVVVVLLVLGAISDRYDKAIKKQGSNRNGLSAFFQAIGGMTSDALEKLVGFAITLYFIIAVITFFYVQNDCRSNWVYASLYKQHSTADHVVEALLWPTLLNEGSDCRTGR
jgi:hypothetical protein